MEELAAGGNLALPDGALTVRVRGPFDLSLLVTGEQGRVAGDGDFVFYNQPAAPGVRLRGDTAVVDPRRLRAGASRVTVVVGAAEPGVPLRRLPAPVLSVTGRGGEAPARVVPPPPGEESVLLLAEIYRRGARWKLRALGQGYADGLAGVARDFGVDVDDDGGADQGAGPPPAEAAVFARLVNAERSRTGGLPPVAVDVRLAAAARAHSEGMAARGRLGAEGPDGVSLFQRVTAAGYAYLTVAEHLVSGPRDPAELVEYCLGAADLARPFRDAALVHVGLGRAGGSRGPDCWTALWAAPLTPSGLARAVGDVLALTNAERARAGLPPLAPDPRLAAAAQAHSDDMAARGFYAHVTPEGRQPWDRAAAAGCSHRGIGENIACGQRGPAEVVRGWMDSTGHRANILKPEFTHLGVGYAPGGRAGTYWTQLFGMAG
ncbi:CAP domain-containing protein [Streptomyces capparidis]